MGTVDRDRYQEFLKRLRQARLDTGKTQFEVSMLLKQHQSFISRCETGERRVDFVELELLAEIYEKPMSYFQTRGKQRR